MLIPTPRFPNLDALRFLAFWGVFTVHLTPIDPKWIEASWVVDILTTFFSFPYLGVPFFFTLSSFLITRKILDEWAGGNGFNIGRFFFNRTVRIWPLYFIVLAIIFLFLPLMYKLLRLQMLTLPPWEPFVFFYSNFYLIKHGYDFVFALSIFWSLAVEEQFYIIWGLTGRFLVRWIQWIILFFFTVSVVFSYIFIYRMGNDINDLKVHTVHIFQYLMTGAFIAWISVEKNRIYRWLQSRNKFFFVTVYILLLFTQPLISHQWLDINPLVRNTLSSILFSLLIFDQALNTQPVFAAGRLSFINYLGKISYGLYVYHALVLSFFMSFFPNYFSTYHYQQIFIFILAFLLTVLIAHLSYIGFEKRFLALKKKYH